MGIACSMSNILQAACGGVAAPPPPPPPPPLCFAFHPDSAHDMTWIVDEFPPSWVAPFTINWGDGTIEPGTDGEDAHEYASVGQWPVVATDSEGRTCQQTVTVPHA